MSTTDELFGLVRQLRAELEWAQKTGIVVSPQASEKVALRNPEPAMDSEATPQPERVLPREAPRPVERIEPKEPRAIEPRFQPAMLETAPFEQLSKERPQSLLSGGLAVLQEELARCGDLQAVRAVIGDCTRCKLSRLGRKQIVFGVGNPSAEVMFVGEGPGADEDRLGEPFVGAAGQLLTKIIESGMGVPRGQVYIANVVKCRPPNNRDPEPDEVAACEPFLKAQIRLVRPKVLVTLGKHAAHALLRTSTPITRLRGNWREYEGTPLMPTFHPAFLLRDPSQKRPVWEDIQQVMKRLGWQVPGRGGEG